MWGDAMKVVQQYIADKEFESPDPQTIKGQTVTVPSLYGQNPEAASDALRRAGFLPVIGSTVDSANAEGTVAYLNPGSGSEIPTGSSVTIYVSDGTPYVPPKPKRKNGGGNGGGGNGGGGDNGGAAATTAAATVAATVAATAAATAAAGETESRAVEPVETR